VGMSQRAEELFQQHLGGIRRRTDRVFAGLLAGQWVFGILIAVVYSPYGWEGKSRTLHPHIFAALILGALISGLPIALTLLRPGAAVTRMVVAVAQMLWSALLIHLMGGRIETHFHVFGSLAFLAFYRDPWVFAPATAVVVADHLIRQLLWPESVYGISNPESWRFLEHGFWVAFEDIFLVLGCLRAVAETREIAEKQAALEQSKEVAERANAVKSQFLANMSHELRTPINGVIGMTELVGRTQLEAKQRQYVETIKRSGESLLAVINDILDFSKVEAGKLELQDASLDVAAVAHRVNEMLAAEAHKKGLSLTCTVDPAVPRSLRGDPGRLQQVLGNLVANAVKFTAHGEVAVRVTLAPADDKIRLRFEVQDSGIGIAPADRSKLFQSFSQVDASHSRRYGGTGLGLAIARQLVEMMGGEIGVESEVGKGSLFWFTAVVRRDAEPRPAIPQKAFTSPAAPHATRLLLAEDNAVNQQVALEMLEALGYQVDLAGNGKEAVAAVGRTSYAAILMDCQMPEMDGYEATAAIRAAEQGRRTPILAVTAHAMDGARERALAAGMDDYLAKPFSFEKLELTVARWAVPPAVGSARVAPPALAGETRRSKKVLEMFIEILPVSLAKIREAVAREDKGALQAELHKLKGSCMAVGATQLRVCCEEAEAGSTKGAAMVGAFEEAGDALAKALTAELARVTQGDPI
jgi:two-component system, sensor histidine kinase and response regulator